MSVADHQANSSIAKCALESEAAVILGDSDFSVRARQNSQRFDLMIKDLVLYKKDLSSQLAKVETIQRSVTLQIESTLENHTEVKQVFPRCFNNCKNNS